MPIDFSALLYNPVYAEIGVPATMGAASLTVIDDTPAEAHAIGRLARWRCAA